MSPGKPWNLVFASLGKSWKQFFTVCTNTDSIICDFVSLSVCVSTLRKVKQLELSTLNLYTCALWQDLDMH